HSFPSRVLKRSREGPNLRSDWEWCRRLDLLPIVDSSETSTIPSGHLDTLETQLDLYGESEIGRSSVNFQAFRNMISTSHPSSSSGIINSHERYTSHQKLLVILCSLIEVML
ncbi:hypothetical protein WG66_011631, partial [Moniliophthora roreri]